MPHPAQGSGVSEHTAARRASLSEHFAGQLIVVPSGLLRTRANDTQYPFRASSPFVWLTGETVEGAVLVMAPALSGPGHDATLYVREYHHAGSEGYFTDHQFGAIWVGNVPTPAETGEVLALECRPLAELPHAVEAWREEECAVLTGHDAIVDPCSPAAPARSSRRSSTSCAWSRTTGRSPACSTPATRPRGASPTSCARSRWSSTARCVVSAGSRARSGGVPAWRATRSATRRSSGPGRTARPCTGGATTASCGPVTSCWPTWASSPRRSTPPTSPARSR